MNLRLLSLASLLTIMVGGCSSTSNDAAATPAGALPCPGLALDCRAAFADTYDGTYQGSATGTFTLHVDILGGIQGSGIGVASITGQVDEFGRVTFTFPDGTVFTGQFKADRHSITGTWKSPSGSGTFVAQSTTFTSGTGGSDGGSSTLSASTVVSAAVQACQKTVTCGTVAASSCPVANSTTQPDLPQVCWDKELALYQCVIDNPCASYQTACSSTLQAADDCATNALLNPPGGTYPNNPDFNPALTGIKSFDDIVHLCTQCTTEAQACYNSADCKAYAVCVDACPSGDFNCGDLCGSTHPDGYLVYSDAATCQFTNC